MFYNSSNYMPVVLEGVEEDVLHGRILFIPPGILSYGSYDLEVKVYTQLYEKFDLFTSHWLKNF